MKEFDIEERVKENTRINMKLDAISNNTTEIKNEVSEMRKEINSHDGRIVKVGKCKVGASQIGRLGRAS